MFLASNGFNPVSFAIITPLIAMVIHIQAVMLVTGIVCLIAGSLYISILDLIRNFKGLCKMNVFWFKYGKMTEKGLSKDVSIMKG